MAIACAGYRVTANVGHHRVSFDSIVLVLGPTAQKYADYFEVCHLKRNIIDYTRSKVATDGEATEIRAMTAAFCDIVEAWIASTSPALKR
jgi:hypothetical protein